MKRVDMEPSFVGGLVHDLIDESVIDKADNGRKLEMIPKEEVKEGESQCQARYEAKEESVPDIHWLTLRKVYNP